MPVTIGMEIGSYSITSLLGKGGMGEVYRARDSKLKRDVAIKVLPAEFARDPERMARAQREAEVLASLNHPHIAQIYGQEDAAGMRCLVLEFVDGETLQEHLRRGPIPLEEALEFARQIADALEAAHERGIVHRDLKPGNVKITPAGKVKVLDFGLSKVMEPSRVEDFSQSPTLMSGTVDGAGVILGTAAYMSPEQAKGRPADARSDIWAFGVVLYEMLTGKQAFTGETLVEILGGVMKAEPDWTALPAATPPLARSLLRRCLQKDRNRRLHDIADARIEIEEALKEPVTSVAVAAPRKVRERLVWAAALVGVAVAAAVIAAVYFRPAPVRPPPEVRLQINTPPGNPVNLAISPDGRRLVFQATTDGKTQLWLRPLESETAQPLAGTENGGYPFWSPDSRSIGFFADQKLKRIDVAGGAAQTLADSPYTNGGSWSADDVILFGTVPGLRRIGADGGQVGEATHLAPAQGAHRFPNFLPDGRHFLFYATGTPEVRGVYIGSLDSNETRRLFNADTAAVFAPPDYVLFVRQETLVAQRIDIGKLETVGEPFPVAERPARDPGIQASVGLSASASGPIAYRPAAAGSRQLIWFDRSGKQIGTVGQPDTTPAATGILRLSPDGRTAAFPRIVNGNEDIWLMDAERGVLSRLTLDPAADQMPVWSPDGKRIAFISYRKGVFDLYQKPVNSAGPEELLLESSETKNSYDWSSDGHFLLYAVLSLKTARDIWALPLEGDRKPFAVVQTGFEETGARFSPDGHWIAYQSNETGRNEIYVQPFPGPDGKSIVSTNGGTSPQWRADGREIFYMGPGNRLMAVPVTLHANSASVESGTPVPLFTARSGVFAPSPDGQRFLINTPLDDAATPPITVILNWAGPKK